MGSEMMRSLITILALLALTSCADTARDLWGNALPVQCQGDLSNVTVPVHRVDQRTLPRGALGLYAPGPHPLILIDDRLNERETASAVRHERCHHIAGAFHK